MVASGSLSDPQVRQWLNGLEPAWTMLGFDSFNALHEEPSATNRAIRLEANLNKSDLSGSTVAHRPDVARTGKRDGWSEADGHGQSRPRS